MKRKGWLPPILVFLICLTCLLWYQNSQHATFLASTSDLPQLPWSKEVSDITKVEITLSDKTISVNRQENNWVITAPLASNANNTYVYDVISMFNNPTFNTTVETTITDLKLYGVDDFSKSITLFDTKGNAYEVICGKEADASSYYVYVPIAHSIYTMDKKAFDTISLNLTDWRDKNYLYFNPDSTSKIVIGINGMAHTILKENINNKAVFTSDTLLVEQVDNLLLFLKTSKVQDFVIDHAPLHIIKAYQLDNPTIRLNIYSDSGKVTSLSISSSASNGNVFYVMLSGSNNIFTIPYFTFNLSK